MHLSLFSVLAFIAFTSAAQTVLVGSRPWRFHTNPFRALQNLRNEVSKRSQNQLNQFAGFDTLGGMGLGKRSDTEQAGEKRAALSTFDSLAGMGLGKRSNQLSSLDTLGGMGFGRK